ncbi:putative transcription factor C3H family [Dioscorea sansibarensis]
MDVSDLAKIIFNRIQKLESENRLKIAGFLFFREPDEQEMRHLAFCPENAFLAIVSDAKALLNISNKTNASAQAQAASDIPHQFGHYPNASAASRSFPSPLTLHVPAPFWDSDQQHSMHNLDYVPCRYTVSVGEDYGLSNRAQFMGLEEQMDQANTIGGNFSNNFYYHDAAIGGGLTSKTSRRSPGLPDYPIKACHYFYRGYCKHGNNCRYFHDQPLQDGYTQVYSQSLNEAASEEHGFPDGSLDQLELEIAELLKSRRGQPVSIASLPMMYFEKYGRNIQADGYLTESQRHGKAGFTLTKLLARLKSSIRLIDRVLMKHSVILAEDAPKYMGYRIDRSDSGGMVSSSHQINLTFPAESTFNEEDVANYFKYLPLNIKLHMKAIRPVRDVRIPCQEKRMFGFVSFLYPDTVSHLLAMRKPHFICGARVLVKRYREKSRITERSFMDRIKPAMYYNQYAQYLEMDPELHARPRESDSSMMLKKLGQEKMLELERRRLSEFNIVQKPLVQHAYYNFSMDEFKLPEGPDEFVPADHFSYVLDALNNGSTSDDKANNHTGNHFSDQESNQIELPDSPFASPVGSSISAIIQ